MATTQTAQTRRLPTPTTDDLADIGERADRALWAIAGERKRANRDLKITITANAETGVGKSSLGIFLAYALDTSPGGFDVEEQATLDTES